MLAFALALLGALAVAANAEPTFAAGFDGTWQASGGALAGTTRWCGDWFVRLEIVQGRPSGVISVGAGSQALQNIILQPDGGFTGNAPGGGLTSSNSRALFPFSVAGRLSGDTITASLTMPDNPRCGTRTAQGTRLKG